MIWTIGPGGWPNLSTVLAQGAAPWDTLYLDPAGSPYGATQIDVPLPFPLHVFGAGTSVLGGSPYCIGLSWGGWTHDGSARDMWIEGVQLAPSATGVGAVSVAHTGAVAGVRVVLHQCAVGPRTDVMVLGMGASAAGVPLRALLSRVRYRGGYLGMHQFFRLSNPAAEVELSRVELDRAPSCWSSTACADVLGPLDYVTAEAPGYGPDYLSYLNPAIAPLGGDYRLAGTVDLDGLPADRALVLLYRVLDDGAADSAADLVQMPIRTTRPDPVTGAWEFRYLPGVDGAGQPISYAWAVWTPAGRAPQFHGRYRPGQSGG